MPDQKGEIVSKDGVDIELSPGSKVIIDEINEAIVKIKKNNEKARKLFFL